MHTDEFAPIAVQPQTLRMHDFKKDKSLKDRLIAIQRSACVICRRPIGNREAFDAARHKSIESSTGPAVDTEGFEMQLAHIDHDHASGWVRGILCNSCNSGLGMFSDNPAVLRRAVEYLELHPSATTVRRRRISPGDDGY